MNYGIMGMAVPLLVKKPALQCVLVHLYHYCRKYCLLPILY